MWSPRRNTWSPTLKNVESELAFLPREAAMGIVIMSVCMFFHLSIRLSVHLSIRLSVTRVLCDETKENTVDI